MTVNSFGDIPEDSTLIVEMPPERVQEAVPRDENGKPPTEWCPSTGVK